MQSSTKLINLNSLNATKVNGSFNSSLLFNFRGIIVPDPTIDHITISVHNAQIPCSFYNVNVYNNILAISLNGGSTTILTLTRGNYNANTLITEILAQLTAHSITSISIIISATTGKLQFIITSGYFTLFYATSTIFSILGLIPTQNYTSSSQSLIPDYPCNLLGILKLKVASNTLQTNSIDSSIGGSLSILSCIPVESGTFGIILYDNVTKTDYNLNLTILDGFDIQILDDVNNLVNFNGIDFTISLLITTFQSDKTITTFNDILNKPIAELPPISPDSEPAAPPPNVDTNYDLQTDNAFMPDPSTMDDLDILLYNNH